MFSTPPSTQSTPPTRCSISAIQEEARHLVKQGIIDRLQPIYRLCQYMPVREWAWIECELEENGYLLRDRIVDLLGREEWDND